MKIKTKGLQEFNVPNNEEGRAFIASMRKFANGNLHVIPLGRTKNRKSKGAAQSFVRKGLAEWFAVYLKRPVDQYGRNVSIMSAKHWRERAMLSAHLNKPTEQTLTSYDVV